MKRAGTGYKAISSPKSGRFAPQGHFAPNGEFGRQIIWNHGGNLHREKQAGRFAPVWKTKTSGAQRSIFHPQKKSLPGQPQKTDTGQKSKG
ncbi:hypothetical protein [Desulfomicrobium apsheronum]|uniref:hypothetical protein n=1 Tax=Desulfomicrobium apsheronum TaxID=52560 RepID=UPI000B8333F4|nr:hypothetical protein [Desulfomicrobium apsheronum]